MSNANLLAVGIENYRFGVPLNGVKNGVNASFTTPEKFIQAPYGVSICVYFNGQRLFLLDDYTTSESGGLGTGHDTVHLLFAPDSADKLFADYVVQV